MIVFTLISLLKGNGANSPIGVKRCDQNDMVLFALTIVVCLIFEVSAIFLV